MPRAIRLYVRYVDAVNRVVGRFAMYMIFAMMGLLLYSAITKIMSWRIQSNPQDRPARP